jgi:hypothetical protein
MRLIASLACLLGLLGALPTQARTGLKDVFDREVPLGQGRPAVVLYANRDTRDQLGEHAYAFAFALREERPLVVVRVDLRDVPGLFRGTARKEIRKSHRESLDHMRQFFHERGQEPPAELEELLFMVADAHGEPHRALGLPKGFDQVMAQAVGPSGEELARGPFPQAARTLEKAIGTNLPSPLASTNAGR